MGCLNRARGRSKTILDWLLFYLFMSLMSVSLGAFQERTVRTNMHSAAFCFLVSVIAPLWLSAVSRASGSRWACTGVGVICNRVPRLRLDPSPVRGRGETGIRVSNRHPIRSTGFSAPADRARLSP